MQNSHSIFWAFLLIFTIIIPQTKPTRTAQATTGSTRVVAWGSNAYGQTTIPARLTNVVAIAAGHSHSLALKSDGTVVAWGWNTSGQATVPARLANVVSLGAGFLHSLALKSDGIIVAWGSNQGGQTTIPAGLTGVTKIAAGNSTNFAIVGPNLARAPGTFGKIQPNNNSTNTTVSPTLRWGISMGAGSYQYCIATSSAACTTWISTGSNRSIIINNLQRNTTYFWQVRSVNANRTTRAIGDMWRFTTVR